MALQVSLCIAYLIIAEAIFRTILSIANNSPELLYPLANHSWRWSSLKRLKLIKLSSDIADTSKKDYPESSNLLSNSKSIYAFGGSTTYGRICQGSSLSWIDYASGELGIKIVNKAMPMSNSDYALFRLKELLDDGKRPGVVLWANKPNVINPLFFGFDRNQGIPHKFNLKESSSSGTLFSSMSLGMARTAKTLAKTSFLYSFLDTLMTEFVNKQGDNSPRYEALKYVPAGHFTQDLSSYNNETVSLVQEGTALHNAALQNYLSNLNTLDFLSSKYGFRVILVSLPLALDFPGHIKSPEDFRNIPRATYLKAIANHPRFSFLELRDIYKSHAFSSSDLSKYFCDAMHQTDTGHSFTGTAFVNALKESKSFDLNKL